MLEQFTNIEESVANMTENSNNEIGMDHPFLKKRKCDFCQKMFSKAQLQNHKTICKLYFKFWEETSKGFKCLLCLVEVKDKYKRRKKIHSHIKRLHSDLNEQQCQFCQNKYLDNSKLLNHMKMEHKNEKSDLKLIEKIPAGYRCLLCFKNSKFKNNLLSYHIKKKHSTIEGLKCKFCSIQCSKKLQLLEHLKTNHEKEKSDEIQKPFKRCCECQDLIYTKFDLHEKNCKLYFKY